MKQAILKIKQFDTSLPLPAYQTSGSVGLDLYARESATIEPKQVVLVPMNIAIELPEKCFALLAARSSLHKKGLQLINGVGIGDADFCGDNDEYRAALYNFTDQPVQVEKGDRLVQLLILPYERVEVNAVEHLGHEDRGGFGSTKDR